jgi:uncharacterized SAM-binding protein YcdF (DUF218 family)
MPEHNVVAVLGFRVVDGKLSHADKLRIDCAQELYRKSAARYVIMIGVEADEMIEYALGKGIPEEAILKEDESPTTTANIAYACAKLREMGFQNVLVVTSNFHVRRVRLLADWIFGGHIKVVMMGVPSGFTLWKEVWYRAREIYLIWQNMGLLRKNTERGDQTGIAAWAKVSGVPRITIWFRREPRIEI